MGGGATAFEITDLPAGLSQSVYGNTLTLSGIPTADGAYVAE